MKQIWLGALVVAMISACSSENAFLADDSADTGTDSGTDTGTDGDTDGGTGITSDRTVPPGTASPTPNDGIFRTEPTQAAGGQPGDGFVTDVAYNSTDDTFVVDNLGFDGDNTYRRGTAVSSLGPYAVYEASAQFPDSVTGTPINQFTHRAIYGVSTSGNTEFAIVRTGAYSDYGFGGFIYQRSGGVTLPTSGQAFYAGTISGVRDFTGAGGLEYSQGDIEIAIDFDDFNDTTGTRGDAVQGYVTNREIYDINGNNVTSDLIASINLNEIASLTSLPTLTFTVGPGVLDENGEILGQVSSFFVNDAGEAVIFETGNYYAVISGDGTAGTDEIVGVIVTTSDVGQVDGVTVRDTGGFIVYRQ